MTLAFAALICYSQPIEPPMPSSSLSFTVLDLAGTRRQLPVGKSKATVLFFIAVDCPIANRYAPEMTRISKKYGALGVSFFRVYIDPSVKTDEMTKHGKEYSLNFPGIFDPKHALVKPIGIEVTPEAALLDSTGMLSYRGRIDDLFIEHGRAKDKPDRQDLRIALDEVLAGKRVTVAMTPAIGCYLPPPGK